MEESGIIITLMVKLAAIGGIAYGVYWAVTTIADAIAQGGAG